MSSAEEPQDTLAKSRSTLWHPSAAIPMVAAASVVGSTVYEIGFLNAAGVGVGDFPITISDYTVATFRWLPFCAAIFAATMMVELFLRWMEDGKSEDELRPPGSKLRKFSDLGRRMHELSIFGLGVLAWAVSGQANLFAPACALAIGWCMIALNALWHPRVGAGFSWSGKILIALVPAAAILLYAAGWHEGFNTVWRGEKRNNVAVIEIGNRQIAEVQVARSYENGVLYFKDNSFGFLRWDKVRQMSLPSSKSYMQGPICWLWKCELPRQP